MKKVIFTLVLAAGFALVVIGNNRPSSSGLLINGNMRVSVHTSHAAIPLDEQIEKADVVVAGTITNISKTRWNQDNGEYWEETIIENGKEYPRIALAYYTLEIAVERAVMTDAELGQQVEMTVVGPSPLDDPADVQNPLRVGDKVVILAVRSELAWREGTKPILMFLSAPQSSLFRQARDGLYHIEAPTSKSSLFQLEDGSLGTNADQQGIPLEEILTKIAKARAVFER